MPPAFQPEARIVRVRGEGVEASVPRVAGRQGTVEQSVAHPRAGHDVLRVTDAERVHREG